MNERRGHAVVLVDWLGRGGIAQTSAAWRAELEAAHRPVTVVTRPGRELATDVAVAEPRRFGGLGPVVAHRRVARAAADAITERRPATVVVQNYVLPAIEEPVYRAARSVGAWVVVVVHDHRAHSLVSGNRVGLRRCLQAADTVLCHSAFVAERVGRFARREVGLLPQPLPGTILGADRPAALLGASDQPTAVHFGVLKRGYKGGGLVARLASTSPGWRFAFLGTGAPSVPGAVTVRGYLPGGDLARGVEESDVAVLPYRFATQSAAVVLAQALGTVPLATAVGGVGEQVDDGVTGRLLAPHAPLDAWRQALDELADPEVRLPMARAGRAAVERDHRRFVAALQALAA